MINCQEGQNTSGELLHCFNLLWYNEEDHSMKEWEHLTNNGDVSYKKLKRNLVNSINLHTFLSLHTFTKLIHSTNTHSTSTLSQPFILNK